MKLHPDPSTTAASPPSPHTRSPARPRVLGWLPAVIACLGLLTATGAALANKGTSTCPGSPSLLGGSPELGGIVELAPTVLLPGSTVATLGTNLSLSPNLAGDLTEFVNNDIVIDTPGGQIKATLMQRIVNARNATCDCYWRILMDALSKPGVRATGLLITNFHHPKRKLRGEFRDDSVPTGIGSDRVSRSPGAGTSIRFDFDTGVSPGQTSRMLFLDTNVGTVIFNASVQVLFSDGSVSPVFTAYSPLP